PTHSRSHTHTHTHTHTQTGLYPCCLLLSLCFKCALLRLGAGYAAGELRDLNDLSFCSPSVILLAGSHSTAPCCSPAIPFHVGHTVHEAFTYNPTHFFRLSALFKVTAQISLRHITPSSRIFVLENPRKVIRRYVLRSS